MFNRPSSHVLVFAAAAVISVARAGEPVPVPVEENAASVAPYIENGPPPQFAQPSEPPKVQASSPVPTSPREPAPKAASGSVARGIFTSRVENREPVDNFAALPPGTQRIYFFTELNNLGGQTVRHRWELNGTFQGESTFEVRGWHWRAWSMKTVDGRAGTWKVKVLNAAGEVVGEYTIQSGEGVTP